MPNKASERDFETRAERGFRSRSRLTFEEIMSIVIRSLILTVLICSLALADDKPWPEDLVMSFPALVCPTNPILSYLVFYVVRVDGQFFTSRCSFYPDGSVSWQYGASTNITPGELHDIEQYAMLLPASHKTNDLPAVATVSIETGPAKGVRYYDPHTLPPPLKKIIDRLGGVRFDLKKHINFFEPSAGSDSTNRSDAVRGSLQQ